ncbi:MAG: hypothetical protein ACLU9S_11670 [Oscillospiraceae bacterium]
MVGLIRYEATPSGLHRGRFDLCPGSAQERRSLHSGLPGFYSDWTDASMHDVDTALGTAHGTGTRATYLGIRTPIC